MNEERLGSIAAFAESLAAHLAVLGAAGDEVPGGADLEAWIGLAFFAGLHEEEARRARFALAWTSRVDECSAALALRTPVRATPKAIAKLAPAAQRDATSLAIRREGEDLVIWALLQHEATIRLPLTIRSLGAGVLRVDWRGVPRALYARGETLFLGPEAPVTSPAARLTAALPGWSRAAAEPPHVHPRAAAITRFAARTLDHGHGGMILVVPAGAVPVGVRMHYEVERGAQILAHRLAQLLEGATPAEQLARIAGTSAGGLSRHDERHTHFEDALDFLARLTATDNALLVDTDLQVHAFGVQVIESEAPLEEFRHINPYSGDSHVDDITTFKGTRHPAGVIFCLRQPAEAAAIIASQDGRLSLVVKDTTGTAEVLGSYELAFGWR